MGLIISAFTNCVLIFGGRAEIGVYQSRAKEYGFGSHREEPDHLAQLKEIALTGIVKPAPALKLTGVKERGSRCHEGCA